MRRLSVLALILALGCQLAAVSSLFAKEVDDDQPIGAVGGAVRVDPFTGTATTSIPINVFPGRNGVQPNLELTYASSSGNGWVGMGWKLELGAIERNTRFGVKYNETAADNGKVYAIRMSGASSELVKLQPNTPTDPEYRAKVESGFFRIRTLTTGGWEVTDRKGVKYSFGISANGRVEDTATGRVFRWNLERVEDRDGNYMLVSYTKDLGQSYLDQIDYGWTTKDPALNVDQNATLVPPYSIKFYSVQPTGMTAPDTYNSYFRITTAKRLQAVEVKAGNSTMRTYQLTYAPSPTTGIHRLMSVQQFDRNATIGPSPTYTVTGGNALPAVTMTYTTSASTFTANPTTLLVNWCGGAADVDPADFNGDGLQDLWCRNSSGEFKTAVSSPGSTFPTLGNVQTVFSGCTRNLVADFDGDGRQDLACVSRNQVQYTIHLGVIVDHFSWTVRIAYAKSDGSFDPPSGTSTICHNWPWPRSWTPDAQVGVGDFNGDGKADLWCHNAYVLNDLTVEYFTSGVFSLGRSFSHQSQTTAWFPVPEWCSGGGMTTGEFNGDGKADLLCHTSAGATSVKASTTIGTAASFSTYTTGLGNWCPLSGSLKGKFNLADLNGDGLNDLWCHKTTTGDVLVALAKGTSFTAANPPWLTGFCVNGTAGVGDFNSDGVTDLWCRESSGTIQVAVSTETSLVLNSTPWISAFCTVSLFGLADFNGDSKPDLWCVNSGSVSVAITDTPGVKIDLLSSVSNGLGASTALSYTPSTMLGVPHTFLPYPVYVVTSLTQNVTTFVNGVIDVRTTQTQYQFEKGYHSIPDRDFRGFQKSTVTACANCSAAEKTVTVTEFHQGSGTTTTEDTEAAGTLTHPDAPTKGLPYRIVVQDGGLVPQLETLTTYTTDSDTLAPWYTPSAQVETRTYTNGLVAKTTQVNFTHDHTYGNVIREDHQGDMGVVGDEKTIERAFANETTAWLIGFPTRETIYKGISTAVLDKMAETTFYYDGTTTCTTASVLQVPTLGHLTRTVNWLSGGVNPETRMAYDIYGNRFCTRDPRGNTTTYTYDSSHVYLRTVTNALVHVATTEYAGIDTKPLADGLYGQVISERDPNNQTTTFTYDGFGRPLSTTTPDPNPLVTTRTYPALAEFGFVGTQKVTTTVSGGGLTSNLVSQRFFDGLGRTIITESPGAGTAVIRSQQSYDVRGNVATQTIPFFVGQTVGPITATLYDVLGRVSQITHPDQTVTKFCYSGWDVDTLDAKGHRKREMKDAFGRVVKVEQFSGTGSSCAGLPTTVASSVTYTYDVLGNLLTSKDILNNTSTMTYDSLGRKLTMQDPDMGSWSYTYDANGNLETQVDAKNQKLCFTYDALNRRTQKNYGTIAVTCGTNTVVYTYDTATNGKGRLAQVTDQVPQTVTFQYDSRGRITQSTKILDGTTYTTTSGYDGLGRLTTVTYPTNPVKTVTYAYDGPYLKQVLEGATVYMTYEGWNALGQPAKAISGNGVVSAYTYKPDTFQVSSVSTTSGSTPTAPTNLTATAASNSQITLNWMAAPGVSYQIERCQGAGCVTFVQVGTATATTFNDMGLSAVTTYRYQVRAIDATNNAGPYSLIASATTLVTPPTTGYGVLAYGLSGYGQ